MIYWIIGVVVVLAALGIFVITIYNKFQLAIIKIDEAENNIDILLEKKLDHLERIANLFEGKLKEDDPPFLDIQKFKSKKLTHFQMRDALERKIKELNEILDRHGDLEELENVKNLLEELTDINTDLDAAIRYYNDNVILLNKLIRCFPSNIMGLCLHYQVKEFYSDEKEEMFEILKK